MGVELGLEEYRFRIGRLALLPPFFFFVGGILFSVSDIRFVSV